MRFGFIFFGRDVAQIGPLAALGEAQGFELVGLSDSPSLAFDPFIGLALAARETHAVRLGPVVTNVQTRHPLILANAAAALEHLAPGRTFLGLGTGNSGVRHVGASPTSLETFQQAVAAVDRLLAGEWVTWAGAVLRVHGGGRRVPILLAGSGPRALRLAGALADIAFVNVGVLPEAVADGYRWVREGAEAAGRDPASVETWLFLPGAIAPDRAQAIEEIDGAAAAVAMYVLRGNPATKRVPPEIQPRLAQLFERFQYLEHLTPGRTSNYYLAAALGLAEYLRDRLVIYGDPADCRRQLGALRDVGVERVCFSFSAAPDPAAYVRQFGETVLPHLA